MGGKFDVQGARRVLRARTCTASLHAAAAAATTTTTTFGPLFLLGKLGSMTFRLSRRQHFCHRPGAFGLRAAKRPQQSEIRFRAAWGQLFAFGWITWRIYHN